jgi:hypothetical protein
LLEESEDDFPCRHFEHFGENVEAIKSDLGLSSTGRCTPGFSSEKNKKKVREWSGRPRLECVGFTKWVHLQDRTSHHLLIRFL